MLRLKDTCKNVLKYGLVLYVQQSTVNIPDKSCVDRYYWCRLVRLLGQKGITEYDRREEKRPVSTPASGPLACRVAGKVDTLSIFVICIGNRTNASVYGSCNFEFQTSRVAINREMHKQTQTIFYLIYPQQNPSTAL